MRVEDVRGDDEYVRLHKAYAMRAYLLYFVDTVIFLDKSSTYTNIVYLWYFKDFEWIHQYN